jgi:hypothetical protein
MTSEHRVPDNTAPQVNAGIRETAEREIRRAAESPEEITRRLGTLEREWDIERAFEATASTLTLATLALGLAVSRRWLAVPLVVNAFLLQHALGGWCPPLPIFRRLGFRTVREIEEERYAIKVLRGDFLEGVHASTARSRYALAAVRR